jgi:hypothetical protein
MHRQSVIKKILLPQHFYLHPPRASPEPLQSLSGEIPLRLSLCGVKLAPIQGGSIWLLAFQNCAVVLFLRCLVMLRV